MAEVISYACIQQLVDLGTQCSYVLYKLNELLSQSINKLRKLFSYDGELFIQMKKTFRAV
jgi:hypothetical protein